MCEKVRLNKKGFKFVDKIVLTKASFVASRVTFSTKSSPPAHRPTSAQNTGDKLESLSNNWKEIRVDWKITKFIPDCSPVKKTATVGQVVVITIKITLAVITMKILLTITMVTMW